MFFYWVVEKRQDFKTSGSALCVGTKGSRKKLKKVVFFMKNHEFFEILDPRGGALRNLKCCPSVRAQRLILLENLDF